MKAKNLIWLIVAIVFIIIGSFTYVKISRKPLITKGLRGPHSTLTEEIYIAPLNLLELQDVVPVDFHDIDESIMNKKIYKTQEISNDYFSSLILNGLTESFEVINGLVQPHELSDLDLEYSIYSWIYSFDNSDSLLFASVLFSPEDFEYWYIDYIDGNGLQQSFDIIGRQMLTQINKSGVMGNIDSITNMNNLQISTNSPINDNQVYQAFRHIDAKESKTIFNDDSSSIYNIDSNGIVNIKPDNIKWLSIGYKYDIPLNTKIIVFADGESDRITVEPSSNIGILQKGDQLRAME